MRILSWILLFAGVGVRCTGGGETVPGTQLGVHQAFSLGSAFACWLAACRRGTVEVSLA